MQARYRIWPPLSFARFNTGKVALFEKMNNYRFKFFSFWLNIFFTLGLANYSSGSLSKNALVSASLYCVSNFSTSIGMLSVGGK